MVDELADQLWHTTHTHHAMALTGGQQQAAVWQRLQDLCAVGWWCHRIVLTRQHEYRQR